MVKIEARNKIILSVIITMIVCCSACFVGCVESETQKPKENPITGVFLSANSISLKVGETYEITVCKKSDGKEENIKSLILTSEKEKIVSVNGQTIKALTVGETYVHVSADGYTAACFVKVEKEAGEPEVVIAFNENQLYNGMVSQAQVYILYEAKYYEVEKVVWSIISEGTVDADGSVTPTATQTSLTIKAEVTFNEKTYFAEKTMSVVQLAQD